MKSLFANINEKLVAATAPLFFTVMTVFITRESVKVFFALLLTLVLLELFLISRISGKDFKKAYPFILIVCSSVGLAAAGVLTIEKIELLKNPGYVTSCSLSPIVACSPVINSPQASAFTIPNPAFGLLGFGAVLTAGMSLLAGGKFEKWWWWTLTLGTKLGFLFVGWLIYVTLFEIKSICLYCVAVWLVTIPIFVLTLKRADQEEALWMPEKAKLLFDKYPLEVIVSIYGIITALILWRFWNYWISLI